MSHRLVVSNVTYTCLREYAVINATADKFNGISLRAELLQAVYEVFADIRLSVISVKRNNEMIIFNREMMNYCKFLNDTSMDLFLKAIHDLVGSNGRYPFSCPVKKVY